MRTTHRKNDTMKRIIAVLIAIALPVILILSMGATSSELSDEKSSEIEKLRQEVASLRQRVEVLEKQVQEHSFTVPPGGPIVIPPYRRQPAPKDWKPFEFNGTTFYVVPVNTAHTATQEPGK